MFDLKVPLKLSKQMLWGPIRAAVEMKAGRRSKLLQTCFGTTQEELMTETTRTTDSSAPAAKLYVAFELGSTKWVLASTVGRGQRPRLHQVLAGDLAAVEKELRTAKVRFGLTLDAAVASCYEAGRDGFWLHRWPQLQQQGVASVAVDSSSIEVSRRERRAKRIGSTRSSCWIC
jgi:hypothetical protein